MVKHLQGPTVTNSPGEEKDYWPFLRSKGICGGSSLVNQQQESRSREHYSGRFLVQLMYLILRERVKIIMPDYELTPSFYKTEEVFLKFLGQTSYYHSLQKAVGKIVRHSNARTLLELGSGTGATSIYLAKMFPECKITGIDIRKEMVDIASSNAIKDELSNVKFIVGDMIEYVNEQDNLADIVLFLYSFHHIPDPYQNKIQMLETFRNKMPKNGLLCIAEMFIPETANEIEDESYLRNCWSRRMIEGYSSTFWASLKGLSEESVKESKEIGKYSMNYELKAGELIIKRENEYLVKLSWLCNIATDLGYRVILSEPCNSVGEYVVLLALK